MREFHLLGISALLQTEVCLLRWMAMDSSYDTLRHSPSQISAVQVRACHRSEEKNIIASYLNLPSPNDTILFLHKFLISHACKFLHHHWFFSLLILLGTALIPQMRIRTNREDLWLLILSHKFSFCHLNLQWLFFFEHSYYTSDSHTVVPEPAASAAALPGNLLERQILRLHPRPAESETPELKPSKLF